MTVRKVLHNPVPASALPEFTPVPRKCPRHDGWTPERQRAFIEALADTGCVKVAARQVNMAHASAYQLRREPGAEGFRAAWDAAQTLGLQVVKDEAFHRAMHGELIPVFVAGKLMGFRRKKNDALLMFILRHYGQDSQGRKTTINYFSTRATAGAGATEKSAPSLLGEGDHAQHGGGARSLAAAEASTTTVKTVISGNPGQSTTSARETSAADALNAFEGVPLDAEAQAEIHRSLEACAERRRALSFDYDTPRPERLARQAADPECDFIRVENGSLDYLGTLESGVESEDWEPFKEGEPSWENIGAPVPEWFTEWQAREDARQAAKPLPSPESNQSAPSLLGEADQPKSEAKAGGGAAAVAAEDLEPPSPEPPVPSPSASKRTYKPRTPKPPFTPPTACPGPRSGEKRKAKAIKQVEADRREAADRQAKARRGKAPPDLSESRARPDSTRPKGRRD